MAGRHRTGSRRAVIAPSVAVVIAIALVAIGLALRTPSNPPHESPIAGGAAATTALTTSTTAIASAPDHTAQVRSASPAVPTSPQSSAPITSSSLAGSAPGPAASGTLPVHLSVPSIGISTDLQPLGLLPDGSLQPPAHWGEAGWYSHGIVPGEVGPAVIAGHVDSKTAPAVFYRLREVKDGARIIVTARSGTKLTFVVDHRQSFAKARFPTTTVYGPTPDAELRLVTCTGDFDASAHNYLDNLVVSAHLVSSP